MEREGLRERQNEQSAYWSGLGCWNAGILSEFKYFCIGLWIYGGKGAAGLDFVQFFVAFESVIGKE